MEVVFSEGQHPFVPEPAQGGGHGAAVHRQIVRQLLAVQGDVKRRPSRLQRLGGQVAEELVPGGPAGHVADLPGEGQIPPRQHGQQVPGEFRRPRQAAGQRLHPPQEEHLRRLRRQHTHLQGLAPQAGVGLREHLAGPGQAHDGAAAPEVLLHNVQRSGEDQPHPVRPLSPPQDRLAPVIAALPGVKALQQPGQVLPGDPAEQRRLQQRLWVIHQIPPLRCKNNILFSHCTIPCPRKQAKGLKPQKGDTLW